ncbi:hypothetical protein LIS82_07880 [Cytobacillus solani]|uniref:hypothetical protein n=1 Tax=Cytobacillus solani TaxID=1637975 RepID=UPI00207B06ED|nr:hypothetical protein [Cytobacillus solani]USK56380.1 hypothetical protein LIS82_07880 [Cytobacillus solani]
MEPAVLYKIFELKGIISTLCELANQDEQYNYPMLENLESKINQLVNLVETNA